MLFDKPLEEMSADELKDGVEKLRSERRSGSPRVSVKKPKKAKSPEDISIKKLAALPPDVIADLFKSLKEAKK